MRNVGIAATALLVVAGCSKKHEAEGSNTGSATGSGSMRGSAEGSAKKPEPLSADALAKQFRDCWGYWNAGKWDDLKGCYDANAVAEAPGSGIPETKGSAAIIDMMKGFRGAFPDEKGELQLLMVNGHRAIAAVLLTGKHTGTLKMPGREIPATNKPFGIYMGQVLTLDDAGKVTHEADYFDMATQLGQLSPVKDHPVRSVADKLSMPEQVAISKDDGKERDNVAVLRQLSDKLDKHDAAGVGTLLADDLVWSEQAMPKDMTKKDMLANLPQMWKAFSDLKFKIDNPWTAGDYVAATQTFEGTNDGDLPMMKVKKTGKKVSLPYLAIYKVENNKIKAAWMFYQGSGFATQLGLETKK